MTSTNTPALLRQENPVIELRASIDGKPEQTFVGRFAATLDALIQAGDRGLTSYEYPAPRTSHYIYRLRKDEVSIETETEAHSGPFRGSHARYRLKSTVRVAKVVRAGEASNAA
jgi:hypothetical protein